MFSLQWEFSKIELSVLLMGVDFRKGFFFCLINTLGTKMALGGANRDFNALLQLLQQKYARDYLQI